MIPSYIKESIGLETNNAVPISSVLDDTSIEYCDTLWTYRFNPFLNSKRQACRM